MRFYTGQHQHYCGVDLHARSMYVCVLDELRYRANRAGVADPFRDPSTQKNVATDLAVADHLDQVIRDLETFLTRRAKVHDPDTIHRLRRIPGVGKIFAMTILNHDIERFPRVQDFASYARLVKCAHESAGKRSGTGGAKIGNAHLRWAFAEAVLLLLREREDLQRLRQRLERKHGKGKSLAILAHKLGRAVYFMLKRKRVFQRSASWPHEPHPLRNPEGGE